MDLETALKKIEREYGTLDEFEVWDQAAAKRSGTKHAEVPSPSGLSYCSTCGLVEGSSVDPIYHPEEFLHGSDEAAKLMVECSLCHRNCLKATAHRHQGKYIGDECCWDERLRTTE